MAKIGVEDLSHNIFDHLGQKSQNIQFTLHGGRPSVRGMAGEGRGWLGMAGDGRGWPEMAGDGIKTPPKIPNCARPAPSTI